MDLRDTVMEIRLKAVLRKERLVDMESTNGRMERFTRENGKEGRKVVLESGEVLFKLF